MGIFKYKHDFKLPDAKGTQQTYRLLSNQSLKSFDSTRVRILRGNTTLVDELLEIPGNDIFGPHDLPITLEGRPLTLVHGYSPARGKKVMFHLREGEEIIFRSHQGEFWDGGKMGRLMDQFDREKTAVEAKKVAHDLKRETRSDWLNLVLDGLSKVWPYALGGAVGYFILGNMNLDFLPDLGPIQSIFLVPVLITLFIFGWLIIKFIRA